MTQNEQDLKLSELYLARSRGRTIQVKRHDGVWIDTPLIMSVLLTDHRIKPLTLEEASAKHLQYEYNEESSDFIDGFHLGAKFGVTWSIE